MVCISFKGDTNPFSGSNSWSSQNRTDVRESDDFKSLEVELYLEARYESLHDEGSGDSVFSTPAAKPYSIVYLLHFAEEFELALS